MGLFRRRRTEVWDPSWPVEPGDVLEVDSSASEPVRLRVVSVFPAAHPYHYRRVVLEAIDGQDARRPLDLRSGHDGWRPVGEPAEPKTLDDLPGMLTATALQEPGSVITAGLVIVTAGPDASDDDLDTAGVRRVGRLTTSRRVDGYALAVDSWHELVERIHGVVARQ